MLENFIFSKTKALFEAQLEAGNVLNEAIVFIEDTKEIWNHGVYFDGNEIDLSGIEESISQIEQALNNKQNNLISGETIKTIEGQSLLGEGDISIVDSITESLSGNFLTKEEALVLSGSGEETEIPETINADTSSIALGDWDGNDIRTTYLKKSDISSALSNYITTSKVDSSMSASSNNPVRNSVVKSYVDNAVSEKVSTDGTITNIRSITQSEYDALATKNSTTLYVIIG